ncbi:MAG: carboxypeptidase regulatory-like domain-containing protein [Candidatus Pacebacteria bacterium]|nr:carboxypeptidase regulatory-like domain-containing protein [Candidatus Paceibacterota bacterium]
MKKLLVIGALCFILLGSPAVSLAQTLTLSQLQAIVASLQAQLNALIAQLNLIQQQENNSKPIVRPIESIKRSVAVISPNGGENWEIGKEYSVSWNRPTDTISDQMWPKGYYLQIDLVGGPTPINLKTVSGSIYTSASQRVMVNSTGCYTDYCYEFKPGKYKIKITVYDGKPCLGLCAPGNYGKEVVSDTSDNYITVSGKSVSNPSITVTSPNGGETLKVGNNHYIQWNHTVPLCGDCAEPSVLVKIIGKAYEAKLGFIDVNDKGFNWKVGESMAGSIPLDGNPFQIETCVGVNNQNICDRSDFFTIVKQETPSRAGTINVKVLKGGIYCFTTPCEFPLAGAEVSLYNSSKVLVGTKTVDASGVASFSGLNPGTYTAISRASGYVNTTNTIGVLVGQSVAIKTVLMVPPAPTSQLNTNPDLAAVLQSLQGVLQGLSGSLGH